MHPEVDPTPGRTSPGEPSTISAANNGTVPGPSAGRSSHGWNWIYVSGIFLLGVLGADPDGRGAIGVRGVFGGGLGMLLLGFAVASALCAWRTSTRRMIPGGAFVVALLAFAAPRTADTATKLAIFKARTEMTREAPAIERLAEDVEARDRGVAERVREFGRLFGAEAEATQAASPTPVPRAANALRKS